MSTQRRRVMRRPTLTTCLTLFLVTISTLIFIDVWFIASNKIQQAGAEGQYMTEVALPLLNESTNSSRVLIRDLYPGGFLTPEVSECDPDTRLLIVVHSAPDHSDRRQAIRESWGGELPLGVRLVYLLGEGGEISDSENDDIVVAKFQDSYRNLTLKSVSMLDWAGVNCHNVNFVLKCDDDVFVNVLTLLREIDNQGLDRERDVIVGHIAGGWEPIRNKKSKYYMSSDEFGPATFPNFTTGPAYLIHGDLVGPMLKQALQERWLSLEDVFLTGVVGASRLGARLVNWDTFLNSRATLTVCNVQSLIAIHNVKPKEQAKLLRLNKVSGRSCAMRKQKIKGKKLKL